jgi:curved DNA-binding protein CbpA
MNDPYEVLGIPADADTSTVRRRYLELVRDHPPERSPERFTEIRAAYEQLRDPVRRLEIQLFHIDGDDSLEEILADTRTRLRDQHIPLDTLLPLAEISK